MNIFRKPPHRIEVMSDSRVKVSVKDPYSTSDTWNDVTLTKDQFARYEQWMNGGIVIQHALYDLEAYQREILISGTSEADFNRMFA